MTNLAPCGGSTAGKSESPARGNFKRCGRCGKTKPIESFYRLTTTDKRSGYKRSADGRAYKCKACWFVKASP